ncbi:hypothetical protein D3C81_1915930 [compost metagenome]
MIITENLNTQLRIKLNKQAGGHCRYPAYILLHKIRILYNSPYSGKYLLIPINHRIRYRYIVLCLCILKDLPPKSIREIL